MISSGTLIKGAVYAIAWTMVVILALALAGWAYAACFFSGFMAAEVLILSCFFIDYLGSLKKDKEELDNDR